MKLSDEISQAERKSLIDSGGVLPELIDATGWERSGDVLFHREKGVVVELHEQSDPTAYSDLDDIGISILRDAGFTV